MMDRRSLVLAGAGFMGSAAVARAQAPPPGAPDDPRPRTYAKIGEAAPAFDLERRGGGRASAADYRGAWAILYFWGLWCPDCVLDGANVAALAQRAGQTGIGFLGVHSQGRGIDGSPRFGRWGSVDAYFVEKGWSFPVALDPGRSVRDSYDIRWVPSFVALDPEGVIRAWRTDLGASGAEAFIATIRQHAA